MVDAQKVERIADQAAEYDPPQQSLRAVEAGFGAKHMEDAAARAASSIIGAWPRLRAIGFSHTTCRPAAIARTTGSPHGERNCWR